MLSLQDLLGAAMCKMKCCACLHAISAWLQSWGVCLFPVSASVHVITAVHCCHADSCHAHVHSHRMSSCLQCEISRTKGVMLTTWLHNAGFGAAVLRQTSSIRSAVYPTSADDPYSRPLGTPSRPRRLTGAESVDPKDASAMATTAAAYDSTTSSSFSSVLQSARHKAASKSKTAARALSKKKLDTIAEEASDVVHGEVSYTTLPAVETAKAPSVDALLSHAVHCGLSCMQLSALCALDLR